MEQDTRPPTSSTSSQSAIQAEWDPTGQSYYGSRANNSSEIDDLNLEPDEFWPRSDSDDDDSEDVGGVLKRATTAKTRGSAARRFMTKFSKVQRWGRLYDNRYNFLPSDSQEKDRNTLQHLIVLEMFDAKLHLAPVANARRVLDLGCGPGDWPLEFARRNPNTFVIGMDIEPIKPPYALPNCQFKVGDFTNRWPYESKFDFIHLRHLGGLPGEDVIASIYQNLSPGGWAEFTEWVVAIQSTSNSFTETSFYKWLTYWKAGLARVGQTVYYPLQYKQLLTEAGFKNVTERKYAVPVNAWPPGKSLQKMGTMMERNINIILEPMSNPVFIQILGWTPDAVQSLLSEVKKEIADLRMHAYMTLFTVYAQKPRESSSGSSVGSVEPSVEPG
ncbi:S-adenosyl-L-methionine-dependent methyltransferase [Nemania abortiva]|nr:S-adenosyl-L-methionine-dependent methyltransferase [Nemania abortiva]